MDFLLTSFQTTIRRWFFALLLLAPLCVAVLYTGTEAATEQESAALPGPAARQAAGAATIKAVTARTWDRPGIYAFYDSRNLSPSEYPIIGGHIVFTWQMIEPRRGHYNWRVIDEWIEAQTALGKPVGLGINTYEGDCCGGDQVPDWLYEQHPDARVVCDGTSIPRYWHPEYKRHFANFIQAVAARYDDDPRIAWWETSVGIYGETAPAEKQYRACLESAGLASQAWVNFVNWNTDLFADSFRNTPLLLQYAPVHLNVGERKAFTDHAASRGVGFKHNGLRPDADALVIQHPTNPDYSLNRAGQYDPMITYRGQVPIAWETYNYLIPGETGTYWGILTGLATHADYMALGRDVTTEEPRRAILDFANAHLGRTVQNTPSVWAVLRESEFTWYPWPGNYEFWLYQDDNAPGGRTVPKWNVGPHKEGRFTRRTDGSNGNPYMYFNVDDGYISGGLTPVIVRVTYLDQGTDSWDLHYDAAGNPFKVAGRIQKTNTGQWKTAEFLLADAHFGNRQPGGNDLRIWDRGDGNVHVHFVQVMKVADRAETVSLQSGVDGYTRASDTYISEWAPASNFGDRTFIGVRNHEGSSVMNGLLRFDLQGVIPPSATIAEAKLHIYARSQSNANPMTIGAYRLNRSWSETEATWERARSSDAWARPGAADAPGDRAGLPASTVRLDGTERWYTLDVTQVVRDWYSNPAGNHGLILQSVDASGNVQYNINARAWPDPRSRPVLQITYRVGGAAVPTPTPQPTWTPSPTPVGQPTPTPVLTPSPGASELVVTAGRGAHINRWEPDTNYANSSRLSVRNDDIMASLLHFDTPALPPNSALDRALLEVYQSGRSNNNLLHVSVFPMRKQWVAGEATWNRAAIGTSWEVPGANGVNDRVQVALDSKTLETDRGWVTFDVTSAVRVWLADPNRNLGLILKSINASGNVQYDFVPFHTGNPDERPRLRLYYSEERARVPRPTPGSPPRPDKSLGAVYKPQGININGDLSDWEGVAGVVLDRYTADWIHPRKIPAPWNNSGILRAAWNEEWLFFAADVTDDVIVADSQEIWRDDSIEIGLDGDGLGIGGGDGHHQYMVAVDGRIADFGFGAVPGAQVAVRQRSGGYIIEAAIPVDHLAVSLFAGRKMGFTWGLNDDDTGGNRDSYMIWAGTSTSSPQSGWGTLELLSPGEAAPTPTPTSTVVGPPSTPTPTPTSAPATSPTQSLRLQPGVGDYTGLADTYISQWEPDTNYANATRLAIRNDDIMAPLLRFDLSAIKPGAEVVSAKLGLYTTSRTNANWVDVTAHALRRPWTASQATWRQASSTEAWTAPGANGLDTDRASHAFANARLDREGQWVVWDVTSLAQNWVNNPANNYGFIIKGGSSSGSVQYDFAPSGWHTVERRPYLEITFREHGETTPPPQNTPTVQPTATPTPTPSTATQELVLQPGSAGYSGVSDTYVNQWEPTVNFNGATRLAVRSRDVMATLVRFDLSRLPTTATIVEARLELYVRGRSNSNWMDTEVFRMLRPWEQSQATWNRSLAGQDWAQSGIHGIGTDRGGNPVASARLDKDNAWVSYDITAAVQHWVRSPNMNHGVVIRSGAQDSGQVQYDFAPAEWSNPGQRPRLRIVYTP